MDGTTYDATLPLDSVNPNEGIVTFGQKENGYTDREGRPWTGQLVIPMQLWDGHGRPESVYVMFNFEVAGSV